MRFLYSLILLLSLYTTSLNAEDIGDQTLFLSYKELPKNVLKGSIAKFSIKVVSAEPNFLDIGYSFAPSNDVKIISNTPQRQRDGNYTYDTFYFVALKNHIKFPTITAKIVTNSYNFYAPSTLDGFELNTIELKTDKAFSNIIASAFDIVEYKTTSYDKQNNIVVFVATASNCDIAALDLKNVSKQGIESISEGIDESRITYYAVIDRDLSTLDFTYFNTKKNNFIKTSIPIVVLDDSVTTQSDISPIDLSHQKLKLYAIVAMAVLLFLIFMLNRKLIYLLLAAAIGIYIGYLLLEEQKICIVGDSGVYLLPSYTATIFEKTQDDEFHQKIGSRKGWSKIQLEDRRIGWVKDEDICKN